jgi:hypothetical protein
MVWPIEIDGLRFLKIMDLSMAMLNNQMIEITFSSLLGKKGCVIDQSFWDGLLHHCASESEVQSCRLDALRKPKTRRKKRRRGKRRLSPAIRLSGPGHV